MTPGDVNPRGAALDGTATDLQDLCPHHPTQECHQAFPHQSLPTSNMHGLLAIGETRGKHIQLHLDRPRIKGQRLAL